MTVADHAPTPTGRVVRDPALLAFAEEVGGIDAGPVAVRGGGTHWHLGGRLTVGTREVRAPRGVVVFEPAEMTVLVRAGTTVAELDAALDGSGQQVALEGFPAGATIGGVLAAGLSGPSRLGHGAVRETLLQARYVSAEGLLVTAGGPTVKNVTGFDLCRLLVGSLGTVGLLGDVLLRTRPRAQVTRWWHGAADPFALYEQLYRPTTLLWDGSTVWARLDGYAADVADQGALLERHRLHEVEGPPSLPPGRHGIDAGLLRELRDRDGGWMAEIGVGVIHGPLPAGAPRPAPPSHAVVRLHHRIKQAFDPVGRLNPGRDPLRRSATAALNGDAA